MDTWDNNKKS